ncbi:melanocortin receptor 5-like [Hydractinia symbiolongicarpus]|uniref:melanocortin receptor 5-like n=1 Tax=Hydractinia symbiolongicarpus TaxID=13093 RepID=UPI00254B1AF7|nr:melanocortin receptor 5-like [Hydractinia symbiolongicarpus]
MLLTDYFVPALIFMGLCLHVLAVFSLCKYKKQNKNQKALLINLSVTEILLLMLGAVDYIAHIYPDANIYSMWKLWQVLTYIEIAGNSSLLFAMFFIITDRFLCVSLHIKYSYIVTKQRLVKVIIAAWIISGLAALPAIIVEDIDLSPYHIAMSITNVVYVLIAVVVYSIIGLHLKRRGRKFQQNVKNGESITNAKQFIVPFLLVFTFIIFSSIPNFIITWWKPCYDIHKEIICLQAVYMFMICGFLVDPLIYVFLNKKLRDVALYYLCCKRFHSTTLHKPTALRNIVVVNSDTVEVVAAPVDDGLEQSTDNRRSYVQVPCDLTLTHDCCTNDPFLVKLYRRLKFSATDFLKIINSTVYAVVD